MKFQLSNSSKNDLDTIWLYTFENWSTKQAEKYIHQIFDTIEFLCTNPFIGTDCGELRMGYFKYRINSHYIFYKIDTLNDQLQIIRILHKKMNYESYM
ncbi:MAG: type II toxin-antitoxin system RelE/ParE family toxin [Aquirufa sp.]